jgi:tetratricopeptide (TPR) repeat protein
MFLALFVPAALVAQAPAAAPSASEAAELLKQGRKLNGEGKQDEALVLYRRALSLSPALADVHLAIGVALDLKGDYAEARQHIAKGIELADAKSKAAALKTMAMSYAFESKADDASRYERQVFETQVAAGDFIGAAETSNELARVYIESGNVDSAFAWYSTGYQTASSKPDLTAAEKDLWAFRWHHAQARIAARRGQGDAALQHVAMAKASLDKGGNPDQQRFFPYLTGYVAFYAGDMKKAIADLQQADQRDPFILSLLAQAYEKSGEPAQAMEYWRKVLTFNSHNPTNAFARPLARKKVM